MTKKEFGKNPGKVKELKKYKKGESFKSLLQYSKDRQDAILSHIHNEINNRPEITFIGTYISVSNIKIDTLRDLIHEVDNDIFKEYLEFRIKTYQSAIDNSDQPEELIYTKVDLLKIERAEYFNIKYYIDFCIELYDEGREKDYYKELDPYV